MIAITRRMDGGVVGGAGRKVLSLAVPGVPPFSVGGLGCLSGAVIGSMAASCAGATALFAVVSSSSSQDAMLLLFEVIMLCCGWGGEG